MTNVLSGRELEDLAYGIASDAHHTQLYDFRPYVEHPTEVAKLAKKLGYAPEVVAACFLHDTIEDTGVTTESLLDSRIPMVVVEGVRAVTYTNEDILNGVDKIEKAMSHPIGHVTKFCDSSRNFATTVTNPEILESEEAGKAFRFAAKYSGYISRLVRNLPSPEDIEVYLSDNNC